RLVPCSESNRSTPALAVRTVHGRSFHWQSPGAGISNPLREMFASLVACSSRAHRDNGFVITAEASAAHSSEVQLMVTGAKGADERRRQRDCDRQTGCGPLPAGRHNRDTTGYAISQIKVLSRRTSQGNLNQCEYPLQWVVRREAEGDQNWNGSWG